MSHVKDMTGERYGSLVVIKRTENNHRGLARWLCKCDCGAETIVNGSDLRSGLTKSCGGRIHKIGMNVDDLTGKRYGRLVVLSRGENAKNGAVRWVCKCDCGNTTVVYRSALQSGLSKSCGCLNYEINSNIHKTHGYSKTRIYGVWCNIIDRCDNPNNSHYKYYGGRGIKVCEEWKNNPLSFIKWAYANGYNEDAKFGDCTIDRIDNNKDYSPDNCRWVDLYVQANNKSNNIKIEFNGETHSIREWGILRGIRPELIYQRIHCYKWDIEKALQP